LNDPLNQDNLDELEAKVDRKMDVLRGDGGNDPLRQEGKMGWKSLEHNAILNKSRLVGVNINYGEGEQVSAAYTSASAIPGA
jgi:hypothetical protein